MDKDNFKTTKIFLQEMLHLKKSSYLVEKLVMKNFEGPWFKF